MNVNHKKLVIFRFESIGTMGLSAKYRLLIFLVFTGMGIGLAQEGDLSLKQSNAYIYEGNELVSEDFISAEKEYRKAISKAPSNAIGSYNLGRAYYESGHFDESLLRHLEAAKNSDSKAERHAAFHNIGNVLMEQDLCKEAVEAYKNALRNDPSDDESRYNLALAQECAKEQGGGDGQDEDSDEKNEDENKESENNNSENKKDQGENDDQNEGEGDDQEDKNEGEENEDDNGKPSDEKDNDQQNEAGNKNKKPQQQPGKLSPQQVRNLLEAMNNQEKKVQEKINARKTKGVKVRTEKDW